MSYRKLLVDKCDIYHTLPAEVKVTYGVPQTGKTGYPAIPDHMDVKCYFVKKSATYTQQEPNNKMDERFLIHFLPGQDVRVNDKVIRDGLEYRLRTPMKIRKHHIEVEAYREGSL